MNKLVSTVLLSLTLIGCSARKDSKPAPASLEELNRAVDALVLHNNGKFPPDTNEVVKFLTLWGKSMPVAPPGQVLVPDSKTRHYVFTSAR